ncbi:hypothetical protein A5821_002029 [Enterococcus sp. 7F3_DIV0205]|uniref:WxL domain-containing protein n=1 Tax=Candidatus Enterococcus palustris TaxID=1834189 RepID=A0AAQ3W972_9ENTE|nr:hypothetical protein [Enterococcus sp. 7F3_DIV0205]OTN82468.1 hypothetical protein A5821_002379 [Enterococcus sp. 7F3_DIV0205]
MNKKETFYRVATGLFILNLFPLATQVFAAEETKSVRVFYYNGQNVKEPGNTLNPEYVITVPASLSFTENERRIDTTISMNNLKGERYTGLQKARVTVESKYGYNLENADNFKSISYSLIKYDSSGQKGTVLQNTTPPGGEKAEIGEFSKDNTVVSSEAILGVTTVAKKNFGTYADILTYVVESL